MYVVDGLLIVAGTKTFTLLLQAGIPERRYLKVDLIERIGYRFVTGLELPTSVGAAVVDRRPNIRRIARERLKAPDQMTSGKTLILFKINKLHVNNYSHICSLLNLILTLRSVRQQLICSNPSLTPPPNTSSSLDAFLL